MRLKIIFATTAIVFAGLTSQGATKCAALKGTCEYYQCLGSGMKCKADDYAFKLALPFCTDFNETLSQYTPQGRAFIGRVEVCLQNQIETSFTRQTSCADLGASAPSQHTTCYVESGFCALPFADQNRIADLVFPVLLHAENGFAGTLVRVSATCAGRVL